MIYYFYSFLSWLLLPFALFRLFRKGKKSPAYRQRWSERMGKTPFTCKQSIWIHTVSLGESIAATPLIKMLIKDFGSEYDILVTTTTPTGSAHIQTTFKNQVKHCYFPYDLPWVLKRFSKQTNPKLLILMETELWPNLIQLMHSQDIPTILINARLSERSMKRYQRFGSYTKHMMNQITKTLTQTADDAKHFEMIGQKPDNIEHCGNIKFDLKAPKGLPKVIKILKDQLGDRPIWIAGSTHSGEDELILDAHREVLTSIPKALLILVPRHPERFDDVFALCHDKNLTVIRRSTEASCTSSTSVLLGDTMGEMLLFYACSDIAFVGGSLVPVGGHNLLEPALFKKPVLSGPHLFNFTYVATALKNAKALSIVDSSPALSAGVITLLNNSQKVQEMGAAAFKVVEENQGALQRQYKAIKNLMNNN